MPTAAFTTLGCKVNQYETQRITDSFRHAGFSIVPFDQPADVYVINSCSVTGDAEAKSRYTVRRARRQNGAAKIVVTGCAAQMALNQNEPFPGADLVVPNPVKIEALAWFRDAFPSLIPDVAPEEAAVQPSRSRATLKLQDGCDVHCSYCSIPSTRPGMTSRPWTEVLEEARGMARAGFAEAVLTGVLIGDYGPGTGSGGPNFSEMVRILAEESGLARIRISSIEIQQVEEDVIELARTGAVVPHFHLPLQSGDDQVLADMNRRYRQADFLALCDRLYAAVPDLCITADVMVGFPTEDEERFRSTLQVCEEARFLKAHVFRFSPRPGTPADRWGDPVPGEVKIERSKRVMEVAARTGSACASRFVGRTLRVIVESKPGSDGLFEAIADNGMVVKVSGPAQIARSIQRVKVEAAAGSTLIGSIPALRVLA